MRSVLTFVSLCLLALGLAVGCGGGGGGGGGGTPPVTTTRLSVGKVEFAVGQSELELKVDLDSPRGSGACLAELKLELPPEVVLGSTSPLRAIQALTKLDGHLTGGHYHIVLGDTTTAAGTPLPLGTLCGLHLKVATPRRAGTFVARVLETRVVDAAGTVLAESTTPTSVEVVIR